MGPSRVDAVAQKLTEIIGLASEAQLEGIPFIGPSRQTAISVRLMCKELLQGHLGMIQFHGSSQVDVDVHLILMLEAAWRLESMETTGGSADALARGSLLNGSAGVIRNFHSLLSKRKREWVDKERAEAPVQQSASETSPASQKANLDGGTSLPSPTPLDDFFNEAFFADLNDLPQLDEAELANFYAR